MTPAANNQSVDVGRRNAGGGVATVIGALISSGISISAIRLRFDGEQEPGKSAA